MRRIRLIAIFLGLITRDRAELADVTHPVTHAAPAVVHGRIGIPEGGGEARCVEISRAMRTMQLVIERCNCLNFFWTDIWAQHTHDSNRPFVDGPRLSTENSNSLPASIREILASRYEARVCLTRRLVGYAGEAPMDSRLARGGGDYSIAALSSCPGRVPSSSGSSGSVNPTCPRAWCAWIARSW